MNSISGCKESSVIQARSRAALFVWFESFYNLKVIWTGKEMGIVAAEMRHFLQNQLWRISGLCAIILTSKDSIYRFNSLISRSWKEGLMNLFKNVWLWKPFVITLKSCYVNSAIFQKKYHRFVRSYRRFFGHRKRGLKRDTLSAPSPRLSRVFRYFFHFLIR